MKKTTYTAEQKASYAAEQREGMAKAWGDLLNQAIAQPGILSAAYRAFHGYSLGNRLLAAVQLAERGLELSPIASFNAWKEKGRTVKKGEKALKLFMPITVKKAENDDENEEAATFSRFIFKAAWFSYDQTEGEEIDREAITPAWNAARALEALEIKTVPFEYLNGNAQGFAKGREIAINPMAVLPHKTRFHEMAHVVLGHTAEGTMNEDDKTPRDLREVEAESVAFICCTTLELPGLDESRGYIQAWLNGNEIPARSAARIFGAADKILKAGATS